MRVQAFAVAAWQLPYPDSDTCQCRQQDGTSQSWKNPIVIETGRVDLGEADGRPGCLSDPPGAAGVDGVAALSRLASPQDTAVHGAGQCSHPAGTCPEATSSMRTGRVIAVSRWREGQMPASGETSPNPVLCAMPTQPGPHLGRRRGGQDRMVRPGRAAAGTGPQRPVRWPAPDRATQTPSAARDASIGIAATPVTILRWWRAGGVRRSARPGRRRPRRGWRGRRSRWRQYRCRRCARRKRGPRRTRNSFRPT